jgi:hypothetical protein
MKNGERRNYTLSFLISNFKLYHMKKLEKFCKKINKESLLDSGLMKSINGSLVDAGRSWYQCWEDTSEGTCTDSLLTDTRDLNGVYTTTVTLEGGN